jgi:hypothetical protein
MRVSSIFVFVPASVFNALITPTEPDPHVLQYAVTNCLPPTDRMQCLHRVCVLLC